MTTAKESALAEGRRGGVWRKVFSLSGVFPLGAFMLEHLAVSGAALFGERPFVRAVKVVATLPLVRVLEAVFILAPLAVHTLIGIYLIATQKTLAPARPYSRRISIVLRVTALVALAFIALHFYELRVRERFATPEQLFSILAGHLSSTSWSLP